MAADNFIIKILANSKDLDKTIDKLVKVGAIDKKNAASFRKTSGQVSADTAKMGNSFGGLQKKIISFGASFLGAFAVIKVIGSTIKTIKEFEKGVDELSAITGATGKQLEFLSAKAIEIGRSTTVGAKDAVEAFKLMGSAKPELLKNAEALAAVTQEAIALSEASGIELPTAITILGNTLNAMELPATDAARVVNVLAAASKLGAKEADFVSFALSKFGGVAESAGVSIEESAAAIELLGAKIPEAETVGTGLRNVLLELQTAAQAQGREFEGLGAELERLSPKLDDVIFLEKTFGKENILVAQTLIKQRGELGTLTKAITGTSIAYEQQAINTDNLDSATKRLGNKYESFVLSLDKGEGFISATAKGVIDLASGFLSVITPMEKTSEEMRNQQVELNILVGKITDVNVEEEERKRLIIALNKEYPELLKNLDLEKVSNEELVTALKERNKETFKQIAFEQEKENFIPKVLKRIEAEKELSDSLDEQEAFIIKVATAQGFLNKLADTGSLEERVELFRQEAGGLFALIPLIDATTKAQSKLTSAERDEAEAKAKVLKIITELGLTREEEIAVTKELADETEDLGDETAGAGKKAAKAATGFDILRGQIAKLTKEVEIQITNGKPYGDILFDLKQKTKELKDAQLEFNKALAAGNEEEAKAIQGKVELIKLQDSQLTGTDLLAEFNEKEAKAKQEQKDKIAKTVQDSADLEASIANAVFEISNNLREKELMAVDQQANDELLILENKLEQGIISQRTFEDAKSDLEEEANRKRIEILNQQAKDKHTFALFQAIILGAASVVSGLLEGGPVGAAIHAALAAAEIAVIASEPVPEFAKGTEFLDDPKAPRGKDKILMYGDKGEAIISAKSNAKYPGLAKAFNEGNVDQWMAPDGILKALSENHEMAFADRLAKSIILNAELQDGNLLEALKMGRKLDRDNTQVLVKALKATQHRNLMNVH